MYLTVSCIAHYLPSRTSVIHDRVVTSLISYVKAVPHTLPLFLCFPCLQNASRYIRWVSDK